MTAVELKTLKLSEVVESPTNPRRHYDQAKLAELAADILARGLDSPILCRKNPNGKGYEAVFGSRRLRATRLAGLDTVLATVREMSDFDAEKAQVVENDKREDLQPLEQAESYRGLMSRQKLTVDELAIAIGRGRTTVYDILKLCDLLKEGKKALQEGKIEASVGIEVARLPALYQPNALKYALNGEWNEPDVKPSVREVKDFIKRSFLFDLKKAPFNIEDPALVKKAGACTACPKRTDAQPGFFEEGSKVSMCMDKECHQEKVEAARDVRLQQLEADGRTILNDVESGKALSYSGPFVRLDNKCMSDVKDRTWGAILKAAGSKLVPAVAVATDGEVVEVVRKEDVRELLKGVKPLKSAAESLELGGRRSEKKTPTQAAAEKKRKGEAKLHQQATAAAVEQMAVSKGAKLGEDNYFRALIHALLRVVWSDALAALARRVKPDSADESSKVLLSHAGKLKGAELRGFVLQLAFGQTVSGNFSGLFSLPRELQAAAPLLGVDLKKVTASVRLAAAEAEKTKGPKTARAEAKAAGVPLPVALATRAKKAKAAKKPAAKKAAKPAKKKAA